MNREQVLVELADDVLGALKAHRTHADRVAAIVELVGDLLEPGAVAAAEPVAARIPYNVVRFLNGSVESDVNGDIARVTFDEPTELVWHERQE